MLYSKLASREWMFCGGAVEVESQKVGEQHAQLNTALELTLRCKKVQSRRQRFASEKDLPSMLCLTASLSLSYGVTPRLATQRVGAVRMDLE